MHLTPAVALAIAPLAAAQQPTCSTAAVVFTEDFDGGVLPAGWSSNDWIFAPSPICGATCGSGFAARYFSSECDCAHSGAGCDGDGDLTSPWIAMPPVGPGQSLVLEFCFHGHLDTIMGDCNQLEIENAQTHVTTTYKLGTNTFVPCPGPSFEPPFDLSAYAGSSIRLTWHAGEVDFEGILRMSIDDVSIKLYDAFPLTDCNANGMPDGCDLVNGTSADCNADLTPDSCELAAGLDSDCNANGVLDSCDIASGTSNDFDGDGRPDECQCTNSHTYCIAGTNSLGKKAKIGFTGSTSITLHNLVLTVVDARPHQIGIFFMATNKTQTPFGDGFLCAIGNQGRFAPPVLLDANGAGSLAVDYLDPTSPASWIQGLSEWNFQFWYRDPQPVGNQFNLSNAYHLHFCP